jgi:hypothetical protein
MNRRLIPMLFSLLLLASFTPFGEAFAQAVGGGSGGGLRRAQIAPGGCEEGRRQVFMERDPDKSQGQKMVVRTCKNGSYYDLSNYIYNPHVRCKEGRTELWSEQDPIRDNTFVKKVQCKNGKWVEIGRW